MGKPFKKTLLLLACLLLGAPLARAATVITDCSEDALRSALALGGTVVFNSDCSITLADTILITKTVTLDSAGHAVTISGDNSVRIFSVQTGSTLVMNGITLTAGLSTTGGGALFLASGAQGWITNCVFAGNNATGAAGSAGAAGSTNNVNSGGDGANGFPGYIGLGGAIFNQGNLTLWRCLLLTNSATGGGGGNGGDGGGGRYSGGNGGDGGAGAAAYGGAIYNPGYMLLRDCTFSANTVIAGGGGTGGIGGDGGAADTGYPGGGGGGGAAYGAAVYNSYAVAVANCTFSDNTAQGGSSAAGGESGAGNGVTGLSGGGSLGGAICNVSSCVLTNCTFSNDRAIGGSGADGGSGRFRSGDGGKGGDGVGGGLYNGSSLIAVHCTVTGCGAIGGTNGLAGSGGVGGTNGPPGNAAGGGIGNGAGNFSLRGCLLSTNSPGGNGSGFFTDAGYNLSSDASFILGPTSLINSNPKLLALADNGGPTKTAALAASSPALDKIAAAFPPTDQRGYPRPLNYYADIGAVEYDAAGPPAISIQPANQTVAQSSSATFSVTALGKAPLTFLWYVNGVAQTNSYASTSQVGLVSNSFTIPNVTALSAGLVWVRITNSSGSLLSSKASLIIRPLVVWGAGTNNTGIDPAYGQSIVPLGLTNVSAVSAGGFHTLALLKDGSVTAWGAGADNSGTAASFGQCIVPAGLSNVLAVAAGGYHSLALKSDGTVTAWGNNDDSQSDVPAGLNHVTMIATGLYHSLALQRDGSVVAWGDNSYNQSDVPSDLASAIAVSGGQQHSLALRSDGTVAAWGDDTYGQTDVPAGLSNVVAISAGGFHSVALRSNGRMVAWGDDSFGQTNFPSGLTNVVAISAGGLHSLALKQGGHIVAWGDNTYGQITQPSNIIHTIAVSAGGLHSAVLDNFGTPAIVRQPLDQSVAPGGSVTLNVGAAGVLPLGYQWRFKGKNLAGATASSYTRSNLQTTNSGAYSVVVSNWVGSVTSTPATLTVSAVPVITTQPASRTNTLGSDATFGVVVGGIAPFSYQWLFNGTNVLAAATSDSITVTDVQLTNVGAYSVIVGNSGGSVTSAPAILTVVAPPAITSQPTNQTIIVNSNALFSVTATGFPAPAYQWFFKGSRILAATRSSYAVTNAQPGRAGAYSVIVSNSAGSITSTQAILFVLTAPVILAAPTNQTVRAGNNAAFNVTASGAPLLVYQWRFNGTNLPGATATNLTVAAAQDTNAGAYTVVITNTYGSITNSPAAMLTIQTPAYITQQPVSLAVHDGSNATFSVSAAGSPTLTYQWKFNGINIDGATGSAFTRSQAHSDQAGQYVVVVSNPYGNAVSDPATLTVASVRPVLTAIGFVSNSFRMRFQADSNVTYHVQYKTNLKDAAWSPLTDTNGNGGQVTIEDPAPSRPARFYRLQVQ